MKCNPHVPPHISYFTFVVQIKKKTANAWEYKVGNIIYFGNFVRMWKILMIPRISQSHSDFLNVKCYKADMFSSNLRAVKQIERIPY